MSLSRVILILTSRPLERFCPASVPLEAVPKMPRSIPEEDPKKT